VQITVIPVVRARSARPRDYLKMNYGSDWRLSWEECDNPKIANSTLAKQLNSAIKEFIMPKVPSFHSTHVPHDKKYHDNSKCGPGSEIPQHHRVPGTGGKPLCDHCKKLNDEGK
jgi:hypothetical protein